MCMSWKGKIDFQGVAYMSRKHVLDGDLQSCVHLTLLKKAFLGVYSG